MKKIVLVTIIMMLTMYIGQVSAFSFSDMFGGGADDSSAVGAGVDDTNFSGTGPDTNFSGTGSDTNFSGTGPDTNFSGTGSDTYFSGTGPDTNFSGTGSDTNYNVMMGGNNNDAVGGGLGNSNDNPELYNKNPFSNSGNNGVPKLSLKGIVYWLIGLMNQLVYLIIGAALVSFLYGILKLSFIDGHKPEAREQARKFMFWGIVSLFVMMSVWGLVNVLKVSFFGPGDLIIPRLK
ncbi:hypothetical protein H7Y21_01120 [Arenimonas sp.]|nr:hypothetical protein [Candidatus Parcubacteria bacterium]